MNRKNMTRKRKKYKKMVSSNSTCTSNCCYLKWCEAVDDKFQFGCPWQVSIFLQEFDALFLEGDAFLIVSDWAMLKVSNHVLQRWIWFHGIISDRIIALFTLITLAIEAPVSLEFLLTLFVRLVHIVAQIVDKHLVAFFNWSHRHTISSFTDHIEM